MRGYDKEGHQDALRVGSVGGCCWSGQGRCRSGRCNRRRRPGKASVSDGTTAGQARSCPSQGVRRGPPVGFVHAFLPGPEGSFTPFSSSPAAGWTLSPAR